MIFLTIIIGCFSGAGILPVEAPVDTVVICGEGITVNWSDDEDQMVESFFNALDTSTECPKQK